MLTSLQLANQLGVSDRTIRRTTKKACEANCPVVVINSEKFRFTLISSASSRGKAYRYEPIAATLPAPKKPKRKVKALSVINPNDLPVIRDLKVFTTDEKLAIVRFYNASQVPLGLIVKTLILQHQSCIKPATLQARIKRWAKVYAQKGHRGLEDKRGGKAFKSDLELVEEAILGAGTRHTTTLYLFYCYLYAQKNGLTMDYRNPKADVTASAFDRAVKHLIETKPLLKEYLHIGMDAFVYSEPSFGRQWLYPNQQWEVDATPLDIMCKVPVDEHGVRDYNSRDTHADYHLVRGQLIRVIDNFSKASVMGIYESSNSYANARLLYKAFATLGKPEIIKGDNGGDYVSEHLQSVIADLQIEYIATGKARGDEKGTIERSFRTLQHSAQFEMLPGFVGHNVNQRQHLESQASTKLEKLSGVATNIKANFMWHWEVENWIENYLAHVDKDKYGQHQKLNETELTDVYRTLGKQSDKKVSKEGIRHRNTHFISYDMWNHIVIGDTVQIRENIDDSTRVYLYKNGAYLGELKDKNVFQQSQTVEELKASKKAYKQRVVKDVKSTTKKAQKRFMECQEEVRGEFIEIEAMQTELKKEFAQQSQKEDGFDPLEAIIKLANAG